MDSFPEDFKIKILAAETIQHGILEGYFRALGVELEANWTQNEVISKVLSVPESK